MKYSLSAISGQNPLCCKSFHLTKKIVLLILAALTMAPAFNRPVGRSSGKPTARISDRICDNIIQKIRDFMIIFSLVPGKLFSVSMATGFADPILKIEHEN